MTITEQTVERIVGTVLRDEFMEAAEAYADALLFSERTETIGDIRALVRKRERFLTIRAMMKDV